MDYSWGGGVRLEKRGRGKVGKDEAMMNEIPAFGQLKSRPAYNLLLFLPQMPGHRRDNAGRLQANFLHEGYCIKDMLKFRIPFQHLPKCLEPKECSASGLNCTYVNPISNYSSWRWLSHYTKNLEIK